MTTLTDRPRTALLVIDVQNGVMADAHERDTVVHHITQLVEHARTTGTDIIWIQHHDDGLPRDTPAWQYVPELQPLPTESLVHKHYGDAFEDTDLETTLATRHVGHLLVTGAQTDMCIRSTLHGALTRGYDTTLVTDAHTTEDLTTWGAPHPALVITHTNMYWSEQRAPGRTASTTTTAQILTPALADD